MKCNYPNCRSQALYTPVVELPTIRTVGLIKPKLSPLIQDSEAMRKFGFIQDRIIRMYEACLDDYNRHQNDISPQSRVCYLIGREVCQAHKDTYNFFNWFRRSEWNTLREVARQHGQTIPEGNLIKIRFMPVGWEPDNRYLVVERDRMKGDNE